MSNLIPSLNNIEVIDLKTWAIGDGVTDDTTALQTALDAAENGTLFIPSGTYLITGTIYIGNVIIIGESKESTTIKVVNDGTFTQQGGAGIATAGCILVKSAPGSTYGVSKDTGVRFSLENLTFTFTLTVDTGPRSLLLTQFWYGGGMKNVDFRCVACTATTYVNLVYLYEASQNLLIENVLSDQLNGIGSATALEGGYQIQGFDVGYETINVTHINCKFLHGTEQEAVAIYNGASAAVKMKNVNFYGCYIYADGSSQTLGTSGGLWYRNEYSAPPEDFYGSVIDCHFEVIDAGTGGAGGVRFKNCAGHAQNCNVIVHDVISGATNYYGFDDGGAAQTNQQRPVFENCRVYADHATGFAADVLYGFKGAIDVINCATFVLNSGNIVFALNGISGKVIGGEFHTDGFVINDVDYIYGAEIYGRCDDVYDMQDCQIYLDTDIADRAIDNTNPTPVKDICRLHNIEVYLTGTTVLDRPYDISTTTIVDIDGIYVEGDGTNLPTTTNGPHIRNTVVHVMKQDNVVYWNGTTRTIFPDKNLLWNNGTFTAIPGIQSIYMYGNLARTITIADAANHVGRFIVQDERTAGTLTYTVTLTSGTWDGTNTNAAFNTAAGEYLIVDFGPDGNGVIIQNNGATLS